MEKTTTPTHVRARRGGREQVFTRETWEMLPGKNHQGWEEVIEDPAELNSGPTAEELKDAEELRIALENLPSLIERYKILFPEEGDPSLKFPEVINAVYINDFEGYILNVEKTRKESQEKELADAKQKEEDEKKAEADRLKSIADAKKVDESKTPAVKKVGTPKAPKVDKADEGTGSAVKTPEQLLAEITKTGKEA